MVGHHVQALENCLTLRRLGEKRHEIPHRGSANSLETHLEIR